MRRDHTFYGTLISPRLFARSQQLRFYLPKEGVFVSLFSIISFLFDLHIKSLNWKTRAITTNIFICLT